MSPNEQMTWLIAFANTDLRSLKMGSFSDLRVEVQAFIALPDDRKAALADGYLLGFQQDLQRLLRHVAKRDEPAVNACLQDRFSRYPRANARGTRD